MGIFMENPSRKVILVALCVHFIAGALSDVSRKECVNVPATIPCTGLEQTIQTKSYREMRWKISDSNYKKKNAAYCDKNLMCMKQALTGHLSSRVKVIGIEDGNISVEMLRSNDALNFTCKIEQVGNKPTIIHHVNVISSLRCLEGVIGQNINLSAALLAKASLETAEDVWFYEVNGPDGIRNKVAHCGNDRCTLISCDNHCPEYLQRLTVAGMALLLTDIQQADSGLEFECRIEKSARAKSVAPQFRGVRIYPVIPSELTITTEATLTPTSRTSSTHKAEGATKLGNWALLLSVVVASYGIF